jgi:hypothetical protein
MLHSGFACLFEKLGEPGKKLAGFESIGAPHKKIGELKKLCES